MTQGIVTAESALYFNSPSQPEYRFLVRAQVYDENTFLARMELAPAIINGMPSRSIQLRASGNPGKRYQPLYSTDTINWYTRNFHPDFTAPTEARMSTATARYVTTTEGPMGDYMFPVSYTDKFFVRFVEVAGIEGGV